MKKQGQYYLLTAVIISIILISLGITLNRTKTINSNFDINRHCNQLMSEIGIIENTCLMNEEDFEDCKRRDVSNFIDLYIQDIPDLQVYYADVYGTILYDDGLIPSKQNTRLILKKETEQEVFICEK